MNNFAVLRISKIRTMQALRGVENHNTRAEPLSHADNSNPHFGGGVKLIYGNDNIVEMWNAETAIKEITKIRKDAVRAIEVVVSVSPEWFDANSEQNKAEWVERSSKWIREIFGDDNTLSIHLHDDETTPHLHAVIIPAKMKERSKRGIKSKTGRNKIKSWGLAAADWIGSPSKMIGLQSSYADALKGLSVERGVSKRTTNIKHRSVNHYRAELLNGVNDFNEMKKELHIGLEAVKIERENISNLKKSFTLSIDAINAKELYWRENEGKEELVAIGKKKRSILPVGDEDFSKWTKSIRPLITTLISYAKKFKEICDRSDRLDDFSKELEVEAASIRRISEDRVRNEVSADRKKSFDNDHQNVLKSIARGNKARGR